MISFRTILHPTDFSTSAEEALRVARALARDHGARLVILHVVAYEPVPVVVRELMTELQTARETLEQIRQQVDGPDLKMPVDIHLRRGRIVPEILEAAHEIGCDLIVIGSHGRSMLGRVLFGSVAEGILRTAECPVITVKLPHPERRPATVEGVSAPERLGTAI